MRRAWSFRRFLYSLAGVVCLSGLTTAAELLSPPKPPPDNDGLELVPSKNSSFKQAKIKMVAAGPILVEASDSAAENAESPAESEPVQPRDAFPEPVIARPIPLSPPMLQDPDPQPQIEQPIVERVQPIQPLDPSFVDRGLVQPLPGDAPQPSHGHQWDLPYPTPYNVPYHSPYEPHCAAPIAVSENGCDGNCYCSCVPTWTVRAEALIWDRVGGGGIPLVLAPVALGSSDLDSGWSAGPRLTAIRHGIFQSCWDLEVSYFAIDGWNGTRLLALANDYQTVPPIAVAGPATVSYDSSLYNVEVNLRRQSGATAWFAGFRALQIDERLGADFGGVASHIVDTDNSLYGAQFGLDWRMIDGRCWSLNTVGKVGIFGNSIDTTTTTANLGALPLIVDTASETSFVGELGVNLNYRVTDRFSVLAGYNFLWVTGVALAPDQLAVTDITTGLVAADTNGSLFYHGFNLGMQYTW